MSADFMRRIAALEREVTELKRQVAELLAKRGPGRPRKVVSEKINTNKKAMAGNKKLVSAKGKR